MTDTTSAPNNQFSMGGGSESGSGGSGSEAMRISSELVVAAIILFFMVVVVAFFFYFYAKHQLRTAALAHYRASLAFAGRAAADLGPARGLDAAVLRALPAMVYRATEFQEGVECVVCLSELADGEAARVLPKCGHGFHRECIDVWFCSHSTCPLCRSPVAGSKQIPLSGSALGETPAISSSGLSATATVAERAGEAVVIEIQRAEEGGFGTSAASRAAREETTSTVAATMRTLRRIWSYRGGDVEPGEASSSANERGKH